MGGSAGSGGMPIVVCGDGYVGPGESCEDTNAKSGDGCSDSCLSEPADDCPGSNVFLGSTPIVLTGDISTFTNAHDATCGPLSQKDVVYAVTPSVSGTMTATLGMDGNKVLSIRSECDGNLPLNGEEILCDTAMSADATLDMWVHAGVTYYVIAEGEGSVYSLTLSIARCGDDTLQGMEQCDDKTNLSCAGCLLCNGPGEFIDPNSKHCYRYVTSMEEWERARTDCIAWGGDLAAIRDKAEFDFLDQHMNPKLEGDIWVGGRAIQPMCSYKWVNGEPWYIEWVTNQPNSSSDECVEYYFDSGERKLSDLECTNTRNYLCERAPAGFCGDNIVQPGEECDGSALGATCTPDCKRTIKCDGAGEFSDPTTEHCYKVDATTVTFFQAKQNCHAWGGYLTVIESQAENNLIEPKIGGWSWIGGWEGGLNGGAIVWEQIPTTCDYKNWRSGEPNNDTEDCIIMHDNSNGQWLDETCSKSYGYVCEKDP